MSPLSLYVAIALIASALGGAGAWKVQGWRYEAKDKARIEAQIELSKNDRKVAQTASEGFEHDRNKANIKYRTIIQEVDRVVERPAYSQLCLDDDGLRLLRSAIRSTGDPGQPESPVPGP